MATRVVVAAALLVLSFAFAECSGVVAVSEGRAAAWSRRALGATDSAASTGPRVPEHGYERVEVDTPFVPLAMSECVPSCAASLGALLSGVRAGMAATMSISATRIHVGGVAASMSGTYVYFTVAAEAGGASTERTPEEAKIALSAATTVTGAPLQLGGLDVSKYTVSGDSLPCTHCLALHESCEATATALCAVVVLDGVAATCTGAGACSHTPATAQAAETCTATDAVTCAAVDLDGLASACTGTGICSHSSFIRNVTVSYLTVPDHEQDDGSHAPLGEPFTFGMISLMLGTFVKTLLDLIPTGGYQPPYSVMIFGLGMVCAQLDHSFNAHGEVSGEIHESVEYWLNVDPHVIMYGLLPPLLFESAFGVDFHVFVKIAAMAVIMAIPGVVIATGCTAAVSMLLFSGCCHVGLWECILLGSVLSATDPVAVVGVLNTLGAPAHLKHMIEGESLLNDGSAVVIFLIAQQMMDAENQLTGGEMLLKFLRLAGGGVLWGLISGYAAFYWCKLSKHASVVDVAVLVLCIYMVFYVGEHSFHVSGVLAAVTFGILFSRLAPHAMSEHVIHANHVVFSQICHFAETHIFVLAGLIIYARFFIMESQIDWGVHGPLGVLMYLAIHAIRGGVIGVFSPLLSRLGYGITLGEGIMMTYGGLRGAVSLAMALMLDADLSVDKSIRDLVVFHTGVIVVLTVVWNGMTAGKLYNYLDMYKANEFRKHLRERGFDFLGAEVEQIVDDMKKDWFHEPADRATLLKVCPNFLEAEMKFGEIRVPDANIDHIFFGLNGYVHTHLYGWKRAADRVRNLTRDAHKSSSQVNVTRSESARTRGSTRSNTNITTEQHTDDIVEDLWVGAIPQYHANEACLRELFEEFGDVALISCQSKTDKASTGEPRSWAYITFKGSAEYKKTAAAAAMQREVFVETEGNERFELRVETADSNKVASRKFTNIWDQMARVSGARGLSLKHSAISAKSVEEAKRLMYEICFTALSARYAEMVHHKLISLKTLDRLQEALKKGQDILVMQQLRDESTDPSALPKPIYYGWNDDEDHANEMSFQMSISSFLGAAADTVRPESLKSVKNFVVAKNHHKQMSLSRFKHIEDLMLCAEMTWAVHEAHHEVLYHVLHGEIVDTQDEKIQKAQKLVSLEMEDVVRESEECLDGMHEEHMSMMKLVHTVIASRAALHVILNKVEMLFHKGFFDDRDRTSLEHVIGERMLQLEKAFDHGPVRLAYRETVRKIFHRNKSTAVPPDLSVSGMLRRGASRTYSFHASPPLHGPDDTTNSDRPNSAQEALPGMVSSHQNAPARRLPSLADAPKLPKGDP